jgi:carbon-monoxide dehydrogenase large subunit
VNPALAAGQVAGGVAQGAGGALMEHCAYDDGGQLLAGTLMDYAVPTAADLPPIETHHLETPAPALAGGFKGAGEAGTTGAPAAILNAVNDALAPFGAVIADQPITPERVHRALEAARAARSRRP